MHGQQGMHREEGYRMRKRLCALLICAALVITGCGAGASDSAASEEKQAKAKTEESAETKEETETEEKAEKKEDSEAAASAAAAQAVEYAAEAGTEEEKSAIAENEGTEDVAAEADSEESEKDGGEEGEEKAAQEPAQEEAVKEAAPDKSGEEEKQSAEEKYANDYIPDGFTPYGSYVLVFDSGYQVKTRLSEAGLTYYYESEEFMFKLNKDLPDMKREIAHILFNTSAPMDPSNTEGEEFPFGEGYVIYINLDNGSYYEVYSSSLDLNGRVFVRDIFESFREKFEGAF